MTNSIALTKMMAEMKTRYSSSKEPQVLFKQPIINFVDVEHMKYEMKSFEYMTDSKTGATSVWLNQTEE